MGLSASAMANLELPPFAVREIGGAHVGSLRQPGAGQVRARRFDQPGIARDRPDETEHPAFGRLHRHHDVLQRRHVGGDGRDLEGAGKPQPGAGNRAEPVDRPTLEADRAGVLP